MKHAANIQTFRPKRLRPVAVPAALLRGALLLGALLPAVGSAAAEPAREADVKTAASGDGGGSDLARKLEIMNSPRWRRAIFELGEWLATQKIYPPKEVVRIKANFNHRVEKMSSYELEYLLDDLDAKFKILDAPEAKEARAWVGQYMSVMSDRKREEVLKDVPDVVTMTAGQLQQELVKIEQKRAALQQRQAAFDQGRQQLVEQAQQARQQTAMAAAAATAHMQSGAASYSPYRPQGNGGKPPFSDSGGSGMTLYSGVFGAGVAMNLGNF
ncbi:MAG: hypothetical protein EBZ59_01205 [Planctomycetia bacterium]|nr:hypothetical protein [Planctomycetia bacterium]